MKIDHSSARPAVIRRARGSFDPVADIDNQSGSAISLAL
jgi:hypothetical protein